MTGWQDSRSTDRRHIHTPVRNEKGENICTQCWQIIIRPIKSSDDERLEQSGFMRTPKEDGDDFEEFVPQPLPEILIALHQHGPEFGYRQAPVAPYIVDVLEENPKDDNLWERLSHKS